MAGAFAKTGEPRTWEGKPRGPVDEEPQSAGVGPGLQAERISIAGTVMVDAANTGTQDRSDEPGRSPFPVQDRPDEKTT